MSGVYTVPDFGPSDILTSDVEGLRRVRVDVSQTGFWEGREFRVGIDKIANYTLKVVAPIDFILELQTLSSHSGRAVFKAYSAEQIDQETSAFVDTIQVLPNNGMSTTPNYTGQIQITGGGSVSILTNQEARETIISNASTATAQQSTVGGAAIKERGLPANTYYLVFTGTDYSYRLVYEERP